MATFRRATKLTWASDKQIKDFLEPVLTSWEDNEYDEATVLQKASLIVKDAKAGELTLNGANIYVLRLSEILKAEGIDVPRDNNTTAKTVASKYA